jgi:hypothetical protein
MPVPRQQTAKEALKAWIQTLRDRGPIRHHVNKKRLFVDAFETGAPGDLFEEKYPEAPPVACSSNASCNGFRCRVTRGFERRYYIEIELRQPGRTKVGYHQVKWISRSDQDRARAKVPVTQSAFVESPESGTNLSHQLGKQLEVGRQMVKIGERPLAHVLCHLVRSVVPAPCLDYLGNMVMRKASQNIVDLIVWLTSQRVKR